MKTFSLTLAALLFCAILAEGQYKVVNYTNVNKINHLLEDGDFIWVCTSGGVYKRRKSNGAVVMHYNTLNSGLKKDAVSLMYKDNFNNYWFAYHGGLSRFDGVNWTYYHTLDVPGPDYIYYVFAITSDLLGNLLFATERGVVKYNGQEWILIKDQSPETHVRSVVVDDYNNIWFTSRFSDYPLCKIDNEGKLRTFTPPDYNRDYYIHTMEKDPEGKFWLSVWQKGLITFDPAKEEWVDFSAEINLQYVTSITPDNSGNMWFGSSGVVSNGVCRYNLTTGSKDYYSGLTYGSFDQSVNSVLCDVSGNIWIGSWNGLARVDFSTGKWTMPFRLNCLPSEMINCTGVDSKGNAYMFGQVMSMIELKDNTYWNTYNSFGGYPWHMFIDENDNKWAPCMSNTYSIMLNKFDSLNNRTIYILSEDFTSYFDIYGIVKDKYNGLIWIASEKGLTWFNPGDHSYGTFNTSNSDIPGNFITRVAADTANIYFNPNGPWGKYDLESGVFSELSFGEGFPEYTYISDLKTDKEGNKWILTNSHIVKMSGTDIEYWSKPNLPVYIINPGNNSNEVWLHSTSGAAKFEEGNYEEFNTNNGLLGSIYNLTIDHNNNVWFSTGFNGVTRLVPVPPKADFEFNYACLPQGTVFTNTSTDADNLTRYSWDINNDGTVDYTTKDINHVFPDEGMYQVKLTACNDNLCSETVKTVTVFKAPEVKLNHAGEMSICENRVMSLEVQIVQSSSSWQSYLWNTGAATKMINVSEDGIYYAEVSEAHCKGYTDTLTLNIVKPYPGSAICMVTVDQEEAKNMIVWDNIPDQGIASYNVYKLYGNNYVPVGNVAYGDRPLWVDYSSTPQAVAARYAISVIDTCGNESVKSKYHQTIFLGASLGVQPNTVVLNWTRYIDESKNWDYEYFYIFRGTEPDKMVLHDSVSSAFTEWNDLNAEGSIYYQVAIKKDTPCFAAKPEKKAGAGPFVHSFSNLEDNQRGIGIEKYYTSEVKIYPNPASDFARITWENPEREDYILTIYDVSGKVIKQTGTLNEGEYVLECADIQAGYYIVELRGNKVMRARLVVK